MLIDQNEYLELKALLADEESEVRLSLPLFHSHLLQPLCFRTSFARSRSQLTC